MTATVKALGYIVMAAADLDAWQVFGADLLGLQVAERTDERLLLRMDQYAYRFDVRRSEDKEGVVAVGWDVGTQEALDELTKKLIDAGYDVTTGTKDEAAERMVDALVRFQEPDGLYDIELFWGQKNAYERFVSPIGAEFVAGRLGLGHMAQAVSSAATYRALYRDIFGFRLSDHINAHKGQAELEFLHCNERHHSFAFIEVVPGVTPPVTIAHVMVEVTDLDIVGRVNDKVSEGIAPLRSTLGKHTNDKMVSLYVISPSKVAFEYGVGGILIDEDTWLPTRYDDAHYWGHHHQH